MTVPLIFASDMDLLWPLVLTIESPSPVFMETPTNDAECSSSCSSMVNVCTPKSANDPPKLRRNVCESLRLSLDRLRRRKAGADASQLASLYWHGSLSTWVIPSLLLFNLFSTWSYWSIPSLDTSKLVSLSENELLDGLAFGIEYDLADEDDYRKKKMLND